MKVKLLFLLIALCLCSTINATTYYISPTGNDITGTGTITSPWKTLAKATATVSASGDIIHVNAGTYLEVVQCFLKPGVSLEGDGVTSVIQSTWAWSFQAALALESTAGTNGNQYVKNLKFDGRNLATSRAIAVQGRSNVTIHDITVVDFKEEGVVFNGDNFYNVNEPAIYATGNSIYNCTITNCSQYSGSGSGCLEIGGQNGLLIHHNTIVQPMRANGLIGWPIKYYGEGWLKGVKIYNNTITKAAHNGNGWNFCLELFNFQGLEIYNNNCQGSLDFNFQGNRGTYPWVVYIHDNVIGQPAANNAFLEQLPGTLFCKKIFLKMLAIQPAARVIL
jgi:Right handed beta helix region